jgi:hypothetical protein
VEGPRSAASTRAPPVSCSSGDGHRPGRQTSDRLAVARALHAAGLSARTSPPPSGDGATADSAAADCAYPQARKPGRPGDFPCLPPRVRRATTGAASANAADPTPGGNLTSWPVRFCVSWAANPVQLRLECGAPLLESGRAGAHFARISACRRRRCAGGRVSWRLTRACARICRQARSASRSSPAQRGLRVAAPPTRFPRPPVCFRDRTRSERVMDERREHFGSGLSAGPWAPTTRPASVTEAALDGAVLCGVPGGFGVPRRRRGMGFESNPARAREALNMPTAALRRDSRNMPVIRRAPAAAPLLLFVCGGVSRVSYRRATECRIGRGAGPCPGLLLLVPSSRLQGGASARVAQTIADADAMLGATSMSESR